MFDLYRLPLDLSLCSALDVQGFTRAYVLAMRSHVLARPYPE